MKQRPACLKPGNKQSGADALQPVLFGYRQWRVSANLRSERGPHREAKEGGPRKKWRESEEVLEPQQRSSQARALVAPTMEDAEGHRPPSPPAEGDGGRREEREDRHRDRDRDKDKDRKRDRDDKDRKRDKDDRKAR